MGHLFYGGSKGFLAILLLMAFSSIRKPSFLGRNPALAGPEDLPAVQPSDLDVAAA